VDWSSFKRMSIRFWSSRKSCDLCCQDKTVNRSNKKVRARERGESKGRGEPKLPTRNRPRICKRSFQLTATMARCIGRFAANSKPIRRIHARKSSTSSAPNISRWTDLIPRDRAVQTDVYRCGYLRRNCAMSLIGLHFAQTNMCSKQYDYSIIKK